VILELEPGRVAFLSSGKRTSSFQLVPGLKAGVLPVEITRFFAFRIDLPEGPDTELEIRTLELDAKREFMLDFRPCFCMRVEGNRGFEMIWRLEREAATARPSVSASSRLLFLSLGSSELGSITTRLLFAGRTGDIFGARSTTLVSGMGEVILASFLGESCERVKGLSRSSSVLSFATSDDI
jgi:hypothetical protein